MRSLYISTIRPPDEQPVSDYQIEVAHYVNELRKRWKYAKITTPSRSTFLVRWVLDEEESPGISGGLQGDGRTVSLNMDYVQGPEVILWHRRFVPDDVRLYLFDDNLVVVYELTAHTTREHLKDLILSLE